VFAVGPEIEIMTKLIGFKCLFKPKKHMTQVTTGENK